MTMEKEKLQRITRGKIRSFKGEIDTGLAEQKKRSRTR